MVQQPRILPGGNDISLPYRTIDVIFNNSNIYLNLQYFDPAKILYDIFDTTLWHPFIPNFNKNFLPFYPPPVFYPNILKDPALKLQNKLLKEIRVGISALRSGKNKGTSWKNNNDNMVGLMERHLIFLERLARGEIPPDREKHKKHKWANQIRQFMPKHYRFSALPSHFNYPEPDRIRQVLVEEAGDYFLMDHKQIKFALAVKVFPYAGKVISIRVLVAAFFPIPILESAAKD
jgi:centrosomal protein CEP76